MLAGVLCIVLAQAFFCINYLKSFQRRTGQKDTSLDKNEQSAAADTSLFSFAKIPRAKNSMFVAPQSGRLDDNQQRIQGSKDSFNVRKTLREILMNKSSARFNLRALV